jgi:hypothetical protein
MLQYFRLFLLLLWLHRICSAGGGDVLDSYGNAVALQHAASAADAQGRIRIVVALSSSSMIWILSPIETKEHHRRPISSTSPMLQHRIAPSAYLIATGVAPDIVWLRQQLRLYYKHVLERYSPGNCDSKTENNAFPQFSMVTSLLLRQFWEDPSETAAWMPFGYRMLQETEDDRPSWGRPLGLRCLLIQWNGREFCLDEFDPSGCIVRTSKDDNDAIQIFVMGPKSSMIYDDVMKLRTQLHENAASPEAIESLLLPTLLPHGKSWQLEILSSTVGGAIEVEQRILEPAE